MNDYYILFLKHVLLVTGEPLSMIPLKIDLFELLYCPFFFFLIKCVSTYHWCVREI